MKFSDMGKIFRTGALAVCLAGLTVLPVAAQNNNNNANTRAERTDRADNTRVVERDNDTDWGWLGLLGLLGLAGLLPKKRTVEVQEFRDTAQGPSSGTGTGTVH
jgi:hypothetical protein